MKADDLFAQITNDIIRAIEDGAGEWKMPWKKLTRLPKSMSTGKPYRNFNVWVLSLAAENKGYPSNEWATFKWWKEHGHFVQKDEKATHIVYWDPKTKPSKAKLAADPDAKPFLLAKPYAVFAREQTDAPPWEPPEPLAEHDRHEAAEAFFEAIDADVRYGGDRAFYAPVQDYIQVPEMGQFPVRDHYYSTLAHEHTHWTGHETRLKRDLHNRFGSEAYAMEELCAELGAAFIGAQLELDPAVRKDHSQYLSHWLSVLRSDPKALVTVMSKAQAALDHLNKLVAPAATDTVEEAA